MKMRKMCINGHIVDESQGVIMLKSPSVRYGITLFEAMNVEYNNENQYVIFRFHDHIRRLMYGCKVLNFDLPRTFNEIINDSVNLI